jgi:hypothetical protein
MGNPQPPFPCLPGNGSSRVAWDQNEADLYIAQSRRKINSFFIFADKKRPIVGRIIAYSSFSFRVAAD